jgi:alpha-L-fucosidase
MTKRLVALSVGITLLLASARMIAAADTDYLHESKQDRDARMDWFRKAKFGMFIHWGLYSVPAGEWNDNKNLGEWFLEETRMPVSQYEQYRTKFNPVKFDAKAWVKVAKAAGMKYIVITSKHHDGFAMFHSNMSDWGIRSTPFQRDPMKELAAACKEEGITFCFYHSIMDWHHPDYQPRRGHNDVAASHGAPDMDKYVPYLKGQLKELLTNYGPIGILWFDGEWENTWTQERGRDLYNYVRSLQPSILVNNRVAKNRAGMTGVSRGDEVIGDYGTPEQQIPANGLPGKDWESCMTMNGHWGYNKHDENWKSTKDVVRMLVDIASKGGNYLLNVGPTSEGLIPEPCVERLREVGRWMNVNGEAIYGTKASPFPKTPVWGRVTQKPGKLYLHVFTWPKSGKLEVKGLTNKITAAYLLADHKSLRTVSKSWGIELSLPKTAPDAIASVAVLEIAGEPAVKVVAEEIKPVKPPKKK